MMKCRYCGHEAYGKFCPKCGRQLLNLNGIPITKSQYYDIQNLHRELDSFLDGYYGKEEIIDINESLFEEMRDDEYKAQELLNNATNIKNELNDIVAKYSMIKNNSDSMYYYTRLDFHYGSTSEKIKKMLNTINKINHNINNFRKKYRQFLEDNPNCSEYEYDVKKYVENLDDLKKHLKIIDNKTKQVKTLILKGKKEEAIIKCLEIDKEISSYKEELQIKLNDKEQMKIFNYFKQYDIKSRMTSLVGEINKIEKFLCESLLKIDNSKEYYFDNYKEFSGKISINQANIIDLKKLKIKPEIIQDILLDRLNNKYISSYYELSKYGLSSEEINHIRYKTYIRVPRVKKIINNEINNQSKHEIKFVNINTASELELSNIPGISESNAKKIVDMRKNGDYIDSYESLEKILKLQPFQTKEIQKHTSISIPHQSKETNIKRDTEPVADNKIIKVDINTADEETLRKLPGINLIKAKKIIDLRQNNVYFNSISDLKTKLNLEDYQISQLEPLIKFSKQKRLSSVRIVDL